MFDMKANVMVLDVASQKYIEYINFYKEGTGRWLAGGAKNLINQLATNFNWYSPAENPNDKKSVNQVRENKASVVIFLPDIILERPDLVEKVRKTISDKFHVSDVPIYADNRPKSPEFLDLISKFETDSARQQAFLLKKETLVQYGKMINSNPLIAVVISNVGGDDGFNYHLKADVFVIDTESNKYLSNVVFDTIDNRKRPDGIEYLMSKFENDFKLP
jgi:hypothetical protein